MYYRRKLILSLLKAFGGTLNRTDCLKLLFLFCQKTHKNHFDFFPYKFGGFSFIAYQDKERLETLGYLKRNDNFCLNTQQKTIPDIQVSDQNVIWGIADEWKGNLGKNLVRNVYLEYPYYATRSNIAKSLLTPDEFKRVENSINTDINSCLFTIGYEGRSIDAFLNILIQNNVKALVDVRKNPLSMKYGFSKTRLKQFIGKVGIGYYHIPELGIPTDLRQNLDSDDSYQTLFEYYEKKILPLQSEGLETIKQIISKCDRAALMCFEADPEKCHRNRIYKQLTKTILTGVEAKHL